MTTPRSLKRNLLNARDRLGESIIAIVAADVAEHGPEVITALRQKNVVAYARLVSDLVAFRKLKAERAPPKRKPRPLPDEKPIEGDGQQSHPALRAARDGLDGRAPGGGDP